MDRKTSKEQKDAVKDLVFRSHFIDSMFKAFKLKGKKQKPSSLRQRDTRLFIAKKYEYKKENKTPPAKR